MLSLAGGGRTEVYSGRCVSGRTRTLLKESRGVGRVTNKDEQNAACHNKIGDPCLLQPSRHDRGPPDRPGV